MKSGRGGKRVGAGRPVLSHKKICRSISLYKEDWDKLKRIGPTPGRAVEKLIRER